MKRNEILIWVTIACIWIGQWINIALRKRLERRITAIEERLSLPSTR